MRSATTRQRQQRWRWRAGDSRGGEGEGERQLFRAQTVVGPPPQPDGVNGLFVTLVLLRGDLAAVVLPIFWFFRILIAAGLLAHRLRFAARTTRHHGGRWRWRWLVLVAAHVAATEKNGVPFCTFRHFFALFAPLSRARQLLFPPLSAPFSRHPTSHSPLS